ncbi:MAG: clostripain-related cysteine peptidase [Candidatus Cloacimonetes bacterium]|nr:clostripain-related cysteine peptidase [Candidatus Cloacimonadota bacterium]
MKHWLLLLTIISLALGKLSAESWTVLVYMAADNNLATNAVIDINSMEIATQPEGLNIIVQADFPEGAKRYRIMQDTSSLVTSPIISNMGSIDSGDYHTLNSFINWGFQAYPADRKMLVIWSHGNSWYKNSDSKSICDDDTSQNRINVYNGELAQAFANTPHLDILLLDACSMQGIEVLTEIYTFTDYVIASADLVPANGFPYETIIPLFETDINTILAQIPNLFVESYLPWGDINTGGQYWTTTCSSIRTADILAFNAAFKSFATTYRSSGADLLDIRQLCFSMNDGMADVDMKEFLYRVSDAGLGGVSAAAMGLKSMWDEMVISEAFTTPVSQTNIGTGALWFPDFRLNFTWGWERYAQLQFAATKWLSLINNALGDVEAPPSPSLIAKTLDNMYLQLRIQPISDPDSLYYELKLTEGSHTRTMNYYPAMDGASFNISAPVTEFGSYQLVAIDQNENRSVPISGSYSFSSVSISPNPMRGKHLASVHWLAGEDESGNLSLEIYNLRGQKVLSRDLGLVNFGEGSYPLFADAEFKSFPAGRYFLKLSMGTKHYVQKFTILY